MDNKILWIVIAVVAIMCFPILIPLIIIAFPILLSALGCWAIIMMIFGKK